MRDIDEMLARASDVIEHSEIAKVYQSSIMALRTIAPQYNLSEKECDTISEIVEKLADLMNSHIELAV